MVHVVWHHVVVLKRGHADEVEDTAGTEKLSDRMRYFYGEADEKFVKAPESNERETPLSKFKFRSDPVVEGKTGVKEFDETDVTILCKCSPDTLLNLCVKIVDAFPMPMVHTWTTLDICKWLRESGYRQYQNTFRTNLISGHNLLLLDASALSAMNIKDFDHIKDITRGIRSLFYFEMTKFGRSITLYPEFHCELYKLLRIKTGAKYDVRRSDLWRKMQLIRQKEPNFLHWDILEHWMNFNKKPKCKEIIGDAHRHNLYKCKAAQSQDQAIVEKHKICNCIAFCGCDMNDLKRLRPWRLKCLPHLTPDTEFVEVCEKCLAPCSCRWSSKKYQTRKVLTSLQEMLPNKYGGMHGSSSLSKFEVTYRYSIIS